MRGLRGAATLAGAVLACAALMLCARRPLHTPTRRAREAAEARRAAHYAQFYARADPLQREMPSLLRRRHNTAGDEVQHAIGEDRQRARAIIRPGRSAATWQQAPRAAEYVAEASEGTSAERRVFVLTFSTWGGHLQLHALAASAQHFNGGRPLYVLGLSGRRTPPGAAKWAPALGSLEKGTDRGKLQKIWYMGELLERESPLGMREHDLLLFADGWDTLIQRPLSELPAAYDALRTRLGAAGDTTFLTGESNCWPWPRPELAGRSRPRGVSMNYMANATFELPGGRVLAAEGVCEALSTAAGPSTLGAPFPNSGLFVSTLRGARLLWSAIRELVERRHFEDQVGAYWLTWRHSRPHPLIHPSAFPRPSGEQGRHRAVCH